MENEKKHKAVVIVRDDASSTSTWSGIPHHIVKILEDYGVEVCLVDKLGYPKFLEWKIKRLLHKTIKTQNPKYYSIQSSQYYASLLEKRIKYTPIDYDFVFAIDFTEGLPFFKNDKPVFLFKDASYLQLNELSYPGYQDIPDDDIDELLKVENRGFKSCDKILMTSQWSIEYCKKYHPDIDSKKYFVLPFSSQVYPPPKRSDWMTRAIQKDEYINFLFVGRDWDRKGGKKTLEILNEIAEKNVKISLTIVGSTPDISDPRFDIKIIENLDLSKSVDKTQMIDLYKNSHFFILPVKVEAFGIVFLEAMSFGLPIITHNVCALPEILKDNEHGICLSKEASTEDFARRVNEIIADKSRYERMQEECFKRFNENFHPKLWVERLLSLIE